MTWGNGFRTVDMVENRMNVAYRDGKHIVFDIHIPNVGTRNIKSPGSDIEEQNIERKLLELTSGSDKVPGGIQPPPYHRVYIRRAAQISIYLEQLRAQDEQNPDKTSPRPRRLVNVKGIVRQANRICLTEDRASMFLVSAFNHAARSINMKREARHINMPWFMAVPVEDMTEDMHTDKSGVLQLKDRFGNYPRRDPDAHYWVANLDMDSNRSALKQLRLVFQSKAKVQNKNVIENVDRAVLSGNPARLMAAADELAIHQALSWARENPGVCDTVEVEIVLRGSEQSALVSEYGPKNPYREPGLFYG